MRRAMKILPLAVFVLMAGGRDVRADLPSGPDQDAAVPSLMVQWLDGERYVEKDLAALRAEKPTVFIFLQAAEWSRPMARFVRGVDDAAAKLGGGGAVAVWLGDVEGSKDYLPRGRDAMKLQATEFAVHAGEAGGPADWAINDRASLTAVVAHGGKVVRSFGYISLNETDVPPVAKALEDAAQGDRE